MKAAVGHKLSLTNDRFPAVSLEPMRSSEGDCPSDADASCGLLAQHHVSDRTSIYREVA